MEMVILSKRWRPWMLLVLANACMSSTNGDRTFCYKGRFLATPTAAGEPRYCMSCAPGTFIPDEVHNHTKCFPCTRVRDSELERLITPCNKSHDTVIHCIDGYYWPISPWPDKRATCMKCKICSGIQIPCQKFQNTKCCPGDNYEVRVNATGQPVCVQLCKAGQFLNSVEDRCMTCMKGTYMDEDRHSNQYCKTCAVPSSLHEKVIRPCTSTQTSIIGCVDGFYRQRQSGDPPSEDVCSSCSNCSNNTDGNVYEGRPCGEWKDAVCCPQPHMEVIDYSGGQKCVHTVCTEGESLSEDLTSCQPCPAGTYLNETRHIRHVCLSCKDHSVARHCLEHQDKSGCTDGNTCGGIVGILIGAFVFVGLGIAVGVFLYLKRKNKKAPAERMTNLPDQDEASLPLFRKGHHIDPGFVRPSGSNNVIRVKCENIALENFKKENLPEPYSRDEESANLVYKMIKSLADLTVSLDKCDDPESSNPDKGHIGCGWVQKVIPSSKTTRSFWAESFKGAHEDNKQGTPGSYAEIVVCTTASVFSKIKQVSKIRCKFRDESFIDGAKKVLSDEEKDWCYMTFEINDTALIYKLERSREEFENLRCDVLFKLKIVQDPFESHELHERLNKLQQNYKTNFVLFNHLISNIEGTPEKKKLDSVTAFGRKLNLESLGLDQLIPRNREIDNKKRHILSMIEKSEALRRCTRSIEEIENLKKGCENFTAGSSEEDMAMRKYRKWLLECKGFGRTLHLFKYVSVHHWGHKDTPTYPKYEYRYNIDHPFTIIITFKHHESGWSTVVKTGQVTVRKSMWFDHHSIYCYDNLTESGDEGAPVLVMGNTGLLCHGHSGRLGPTGESGAWSDLIPFIADFSPSAPVNN